MTDVSTTCAVVIFRVKQTADKYLEEPMKMVLRDLYENEIWLKVNFASIFLKIDNQESSFFSPEKLTRYFFFY